MKPILNFIIIVAVLVVFSSCTNNKRIAIKPATTAQRDLFTCKGLSQDNRWVGVTDEFLPEKDPRVIVVAGFSPEDKNSWATIELVNPLSNVAAQEEIRYPKKDFIGIEFQMRRLMKLGGIGEWKVLFSVDGLPVETTKFYIGEKAQFAQEEEGPKYHVVGAEDESQTEEDTSELSAKSAEDRFADYIQEVTPELQTRPSSDSSPLTPSLPSENIQPTTP